MVDTCWHMLTHVDKWNHFFALRVCPFDLESELTQLRCAIEEASSDFCLNIHLFMLGLLWFDILCISQAVLGISGSVRFAAQMPLFGTICVMYRFCGSEVLLVLTWAPHVLTCHWIGFQDSRVHWIYLGRVAMFATIGYILPEYWRFPGYLSKFLDIKFADVPNGLSAFTKVRVVGGLGSSQLQWSLQYLARSCLSCEKLVLLSIQQCKNWERRSISCMLLHLTSTKHSLLGTGTVESMLILYIILYI